MGQRQEIRKKNGQIVGTIEERNGRLEVRKFGGPVLGTYDPKQNVTRDHTGKTVAKGNILVTFLQPYM